MAENINEEQFEQAQSQQIERFKLKMREAFEDVLGTFYCDVSIHAATDAHQNYRNHLREELRDSFVKEIAQDYSYQSWAHGIRMKLLKDHPDQLRNKIIEDLTERNASLESHLDQLRRRYS